MAYYAKVVNGIVEKIIVADAEFMEGYVDDSPGEWLETDYHTSGNQHTEGGTPFRKNYAGIGYSYNSELDAFIPRKPFPSWLLNEETGLWEAPIAKSIDEENYIWDEETLSWDAGPSQP